MGLSALELVNLLAGGPKKPALAPADATAVAHPRGSANGVVLQQSPDDSFAGFGNKRDLVPDDQMDVESAEQAEQAPDTNALRSAAGVHTVNGEERRAIGNKSKSAYDQLLLLRALAQSKKVP